MMCRINLRCFFKSLWNLLKQVGIFIGMIAAVILLAFAVILAIAAVLWFIYFITTLDPMILVAVVVAFLAYVTIASLFRKQT
ncbi:hypothetical protein HAV1_gp39 [Hyperthermophilic Archaeal Virus 1]|uniref:hypothetical protein n=1 Tax=Hyperthermophilic Archaeal Virus 1 TaxID=762905 RepID=UPI0001DBAE12|nr:hypothetical protein HAV1_gp39 [Hyperthermophilic Archaeal Virus 1]ADJ54262.1 hypothetical protein HAV1_gp39 [Hyperthermophilic Archaeal Virus 1]